MDGDNARFLLREARPSDLADVITVCEASGRAAWTAEMIVERPDRIVLATTIGVWLAGIGKTHLHFEPDGATPAGHYLGGVIVGPAWRRRGVGAELTRARLEWIWQRAERAFYFANEHNTASIELHRTMGFEPIATAPTFHGVSADNGQSQLILFEARRP